MLKKDENNQSANMNLAIFTLYEGDYHLGVAALINSAVKCGFKGKIFILCKDEQPAWAGSNQLRELFDKTGAEACSEKCVPPRHLGFHKPFAALHILEAHPELDGVVYADPDVVFLAPWSFFETWVESGVALCLDSNFPWLHKKHPWRRDWRALAERAGLQIRQEAPEYPNSGFFALTKSRAEFLQIWAAVTLQFEKEGGDTSRFAMHERFQAIVGDQDILAASLHAYDESPSYLGQEGMGFNGHYFILSHATESPKPWRKCFVKFALKGQRPSRSAKFWLEHSRYPIQAMSRYRYFAKKLDLSLALVLSRLWKE